MAKELMNVRIRKARELLSNTSQPVSKIGRSLGFASLVSFSRAFSNQSGESPLQYRNRVAKDPRKGYPENASIEENA